MRLACVTHGHAPAALAFYDFVRTTEHREPSDVMKTLMYRPEFFGAAQCVLTQEVMRGVSPWSVGERELFAAFTSSLNRCLF